MRKIWWCLRGQGQHGALTLGRVFGYGRNKIGGFEEAGRALFEEA